MKNKNNGFTLIELMIVVAIIGILASIALPAYQTYVARAILSTLQETAAAGKTAVLSRYQELGTMPLPGTVEKGIAELSSVTEGLDKAIKASPYQSSVEYLKSSPTKARYNITLDNINGNINGQTLSFVYSDNESAFTMSCVVSTSIEKRYLPKNCGYNE